MTMPSQVDIIRAHVADALARGAKAVVGGVESVRPPFVEPVVLVDVPEDVAGRHRGDVRPDDDRQPGARRGRGGRAGQRQPVRPRRGRVLQGPRRGTGPAAAGRAWCRSTRWWRSPRVPALPFGGVGDSGFGRIHGEDGLREFTRAKAITRQRWASPVNLTSFERSKADDRPRRPHHPAAVRARLDAERGRRPGELACEDEPHGVEVVLEAAADQHALALAGEVGEPHRARPGHASSPSGCWSGSARGGRSR